MNRFTTAEERLHPMSAFASMIALSSADYSWRKESSCRDTNPELFFPVGTTGPALAQIETAKNVCRSCPVQSECLEFAITTNQDSGIWGGTSEEERRKLRRSWQLRRRSAAGVAS